MSKMRIKAREWVTDRRESNLDLEKISKMKKGELTSQIKLPRKDGRYVISSRKSYIDLADYQNDPDRYKNDLEVLMRDVKYIVTDDRYRNMSVDFMFTEGDEIETMSQIHFLINMIMWKPFFALKIPIDKDKVFRPTTLNNKAYVDYINNKIIEPYKHLTTHNEMSILLAEMYDEFIFLCEKNGIYLGISFSLNELFDIWDKNEELRDICHTKLKRNMQLSEAEEFLRKQAKRMKQIFLEDNQLDDTSLKAIIRSGAMNDKQMREFFIHTGEIDASYKE